MLIITNNPKWLDYKKADINIVIEYRQESFLDVLLRARAYIHNNYVLLTHPLYGNISPTSTLYRTLVVREGEKLDFDSVNLIENSIEKVARILRVDKSRHLSKEILEDLEFIDYALIKETLDQI